MGRQVQSVLLNGSHAFDTILCGIYEDSVEGGAASSHRWPHGPFLIRLAGPASPAEYF
jgi:hypothetical protein